MRIPVVRPASDVSLLNVVGTHRTTLLKQAFVYGAVLLRGWETDVDNFGRVPGALGLDTQQSLKQDAGCDVTPFHHDGVMQRDRPTHLVLQCSVAPRDDDATFLTDSRALATHVTKTHPRVAARLDDGVRYTRVFPPVDDGVSRNGGSWRAAFGCETKIEVELALRRQGMEWEWWDDVLWTRTAPLPAFRHEPKRGKLVFCNAILEAHFGWTDAHNAGTNGVCFADGRPIPSEFVADVQAYARRAQYEVRWKAGDVLIVDNSVTMQACNAANGCLLTLRCKKNAHYLG